LYEDERAAASPEPPDHPFNLHAPPKGERLKAAQKLLSKKLPLIRMQ
jgi:hypothetical protein